MLHVDIVLDLPCSTELASNTLLDFSLLDSVGEKSNTAALEDYVIYGETQPRPLVQTTKENSSCNALNQIIFPARFYRNLHDDGKLTLVLRNVPPNQPWKASECENNISDLKQYISEYVSQYVSDCEMNISFTKTNVSECGHNISDSKQCVSDRGVGRFSG